MYRALAILLLNVLLLPSSVMAAPKVVVISLDGGTPRIITNLLDRGVLPANRGIGQLRSSGFFADRSVVAAPSLTAVNHITIATGSTSAKTDIASNTFHLLASPFTSNVIGFGAPIGGYEIAGPAKPPTRRRFRSGIRSAPPARRS